MNVKDHLPRRAPKKTGKSGIKPLDADDDFDKPVTKQSPMGPLAADNPPQPSVMNGRIKVFYDKPVISKEKDSILIALKFTVPLEENHDKLLPKIVADAHHDLLKRGRSRMNLKDIPAQHAMLFLSSDNKEDLITMPACKMIGTNVAVVQRKGEGTARKVVRLAFSLQAPHSKVLANFAELNLANDFWLELEDSQEELWDAEED
jgi:hypothetical protein